MSITTTSPPVFCHHAGSYPAGSEMEETYQAPALGNSTSASHVQDAAAALEYPWCITLILSVHGRKPRIQGSLCGLSFLVNLFTFEISSVYLRADISIHSGNPNP